MKLTEIERKVLSVVTDIPESTHKICKKLKMGNDRVKPALLGLSLKGKVECNRYYSWKCLWNKK